MEYLKFSPIMGFLSLGEILPNTHYENDGSRKGTHLTAVVF